jgi:hypothetical protein
MASTIPVNNFFRLASTARFGKQNIGLQEEILADGPNLERSEPEGIAPIQTSAFYDRPTLAHKARRDKESHGIHQTR